MHETTRNLLRHIKSLPQVAHPPIDWSYVNAWDTAGHPDLDAAPEPDRLAALEARVNIHSATFAKVSVRLDATDARVAALEPRPSEPPPATRFVPTEPGWYWWREDTYKGGSPRIAEVVLTSDGRLTAHGCAADEYAWLSPVAPYQPTRTEEEARREPRRGDRWKSQYYEYTVLETQGASWPLLLRDGRATSCFPGRVGEPGETYLGNFAHELEAP